MKKSVVFYVLMTFIGLSPESFGQVFTNKEVGQKNQERVDSLKTARYPYVLPIWGEKATNLGYSLKFGKDSPGKP